MDRRIRHRGVDRVLGRDARVSGARLGGLHLGLPDRDYEIVSPPERRHARPRSTRCGDRFRDCHPDLRIVVTRYGSRRIAIWTAAGFCIALVPLALARNLTALIAGLVLYGVMAGANDVA